MKQAETSFDWRALSNAADKTPWHANAGLHKLNFNISIVYMGELLCGYSINITSGLLALPWWNHDLGYPDAARVGAINAMAYIGGFFFGFLAGYTNDNLGRKFTLRDAATMIIGTIMGCCAGTTSGSASLAIYCVGKLLIGAGMATGTIACQIMIHEISHPRYRSFCASFFDSFWILGSVIASVIVFGCSYIDSSWSWRIPYLVQAVFALYMLVAVQFVPESPRWLLSKNRDEEAFRFMVKYHGDGDATDELVVWEFEETKAALAAEREEGASSWMHIWRTPSDRRRVALAAGSIAIGQWNGIAIVYFYYSVVLGLVGITDPSTTTGIGVGLNMWGFVGELVGAWLTTKIGRRTHMLWAWPICGLWMTCLTITSGVFTTSGQENRAAGIAAVAFVWLFNGTQNATNPIFYSYPAEILSFAIRAKGMVAWNVVYQLTGVYNSFVNSIALSSIGFYYYIIYIGLIAIEWVAIYFLMVETHGRSLEEIDIQFNGSNSAVAKADAQIEANLARTGHVAQVPSKDSDDKMA